MATEKNIDYQALGQIIDTTWGRSSTPATSTFSVKINVLNANTLRIDYHTVFNFANDKEMLTVKLRIEEEAKRVTKGVVASTKKTYKRLTGSTLRFEEISSGGMFELVGFGKPSSRKTAHYKFTTTFEIG